MSDLACSSFCSSMRRADIHLALEYGIFTYFSRIFQKYGQYGPYCGNMGHLMSLVHSLLKLSCRSPLAGGVS